MDLPQNIKVTLVNLQFLGFLDKGFSTRNHQFQKMDSMCFLVVLVLEPVHIKCHQFHYLHSHY